MVAYLAQMLFALLGGLVEGLVILGSVVCCRCCRMYFVRRRERRRRAREPEMHVTRRSAADGSPVDVYVSVADRTGPFVVADLAAWEECQGGNERVDSES